MNPPVVIVPVVSKLRRWLFTTGATVIGGGIAGAGAAAFDPSKYRFPQDFGSGKLWPFFFMGCALTLGGSVLRSPWGVKMMSSFQASQAQLKQSQADIEKAKAELRDSVKPQ